MEQAEHTMSLSGFIRGHHEEIISESPAKTLMPPGPEMTEAELRDHADDILTAVVQDMSIAQSPEEQSSSRGVAAPLGRWNPPGRFTPTIASSTASRSAVLRNFARSGRRCCDSMRRAENRPPVSVDSTKLSTK
jgi:hypothetical protein